MFLHCCLDNCSFLPDSDEVMRAMNLKQGEIQFYAKARSN